MTKIRESDFSLTSFSSSSLCGVAEAEGFVNHWLRHFADFFQKVGHVLGIDVSHALHGMPERGKGHVGEAVAHFDVRCPRSLPNAGIVCCSGALGSGAAFVVGEGIDDFGGGSCVEQKVVFVAQTGQQFFQVVVGEACIFDGIVKEGGG